jgi:hypothetical protein
MNKTNFITSSSIKNGEIILFGVTDCNKL